MARAAAQTVLQLMREKKVLSAPVFNDEARAAEPVGFVDMVEIVHLMLNALKLAFKLPATDPMAIRAAHPCSPCPLVLQPPRRKREEEDSSPVACG